MAKVYFIHRMTFVRVFWGCLLFTYYSIFAIQGKELYVGDPGHRFIMYCGFVSICKHVFDFRSGNSISFDPSLVKPGDVIGVRDIPLFFKKMHPHIKSPYILLTHGCALETVEESHRRYLDDDTIIAWFSIHPPKWEHKKFYPLPLGIQPDSINHWYAKEQQSNFINGGLIAPKDWCSNDYKKVDNFFRQLREIEKTKLLYMNFNFGSTPDRRKARNIFKSWKFSSVIQKRLPFKEYLSEIATYKFALSPRGWGPDCLRTWEALLVGVIPIVRRGEFGLGSTPENYNRRSGAQIDTLYENLPVLIVDDWREINEQFLNKKYLEISSRKYDINKLYMQYWHDKIGKVRDDFLAKMARKDPASE